MDALTQEQWTAIGPLLNNHAARLDATVNGGTYVDTTAKGFLFHLVTDVVNELAIHERERQEDSAWDEHRRRQADESSEEDYYEHVREMQCSEISQRDLDGRMG